MSESGAVAAARPSSWKVGLADFLAGRRWPLLLPSVGAAILIVYGFAGSDPYWLR